MVIRKAHKSIFVDERYGLIKNIYNLPTFAGLPRVHVKMAFEGLYHYSPSLNALELISEEEDVFDITSYIMMLQNLENTSLVLFTTSIFSRMTFKYDARAYRYLLLEAGAMLQNISLVATKYKLVSTCIGGTDDNKVEELLGIDGIKESVVNCLLLTRDGSWQ